MQLHGALTDRYRDFAAYARDDSATFEAWALAVAEDPQMHAWLAGLPRLKQQPNLVFAAARWHGAPAPGDYEAMKAVLLAHEHEVKATIGRRATQTNEVGRLATLTPLMSALDEPLALIEVGASAGLCLYPDRYDYQWPPLGGLTARAGPTLSATVEGDMPVPQRHPVIAWRAGVDLNPLDVRDEDAMAWLANLVWPEQEERRERLLQAIKIATHEPPHLVRGDLFDKLPGLLEEAARHATPVVFHSAVVAYLDEGERERFHDLMTRLVADKVCRWISNEAPHVLPRVTGGLDVPPGRFVTALDGRPVALSHGHGHSMRWL